MATDTWWDISKGTVAAPFFQEDDARWLDTNLEDKCPTEGLEWNAWFRLTTMNLWQERNEVVFQQATVSRTDLYHRIYSQAMGLRSTIKDSSSINVLDNHQADCQTKWEAPPEGWVKLNIDVVVTSLGATTAVGGVLRSANGNFILGFAMDIREATITMAELKAISTGLNLLRRKGYSKILINSDSLTAIQMVQGGCSSLHPCFQLIKEIHNLMRRFNECTISHTLKEANQVVDSFVKFGLTLTMCSRIFFIVFLLLFLFLSMRKCWGLHMFPRGF